MKLQHDPKEYISPLAGAPRWMLRIRSEKPTVITDKEENYGSHSRALHRLYILARRTSYMQNGPNREVWCSLEVYHVPSRKWETVFQAKTKLKEGARPI